ncbi:hypothetical protein AVEN_30833-1 [Araneus ventricosus]|uniref:Uncharacterized protein n=1 Tax=Araneus ventricosus TaxID=182803 RepID=A0A4Y2KLS2_ARAVE|nr:hypothetical protein AVEN_30833-1 [Araneus ventricosus]
MICPGDEQFNQPQTCAPLPVSSLERATTYCVLLGGQLGRSSNGHSARSLQTPPGYVIQVVFRTSRLPFSSRFRRVRWESGLVGIAGSGDPTTLIFF